jgi:hypothetical protein
MTATRISKTIVRLAIAVLLALPPAVSLAAQQNAAGPGDAPAPGMHEKSVQKELDSHLAERRKAMLDEARDALAATNDALDALEEDRAQDALEALSRATGKLELAVARDPELALAPVDVSISTYDLYTTPKMIREARDEARQMLDDGRVQEARALLSDLASEIVINVTNVPLATYPDAIMSASRSIDAGRIDEAKATLSSALNTLVVTNQVIALPVLRAQIMLDEAEDLTNGEPATSTEAMETKQARKTEQTAKTAETDSSAETAASETRRKRVDELVDDAREQLEIAELLGYGGKAEYAEFRKQIAELESRIHGDQDTQGLFAHLRQSLHDFDESLFD